MIAVKLRKKKIDNNRYSLYLDYYPPITNPKTGKPTRREFLKLYINSKPKGLQKQQDKETLLLADQIRHKRHNEINKPEAYTEHEKERVRQLQQGKQSFSDYFKKLTAKGKGWETCITHFNNFTDERQIAFSDITEPFCNSFKEYLLNDIGITQNSAAIYWQKFKAALRRSGKEGFLNNNILPMLETIKMLETRRECLTLEELNALAKTDCKRPIIKRAALFMALTGLRSVDVKKLLWGNIEKRENGYIIKFTQQKTKGIESLPISQQAYKLLGDPKQPTDRIFEGLKNSNEVNKALLAWVRQAGITKHVTFHIMRHTFATLQLSNGTDIYTVSKMLGHRDLKTTQIYAKVIDETKRIAADKIKLDL